MLAGMYFIEKAQRHGNREFYSQVNKSPKSPKLSFQPKPSTKAFMSIAKHYGKKLAQYMNALALKKKTKTKRKTKKSGKLQTQKKQIKQNHLLFAFFCH